MSSDPSVGSVTEQLARATTATVKPPVELGPDGMPKLSKSAAKKAAKAAAKLAELEAKKAVAATLSAFDPALVAAANEQSEKAKAITLTEDASLPVANRIEIASVRQHIDERVKIFALAHPQQRTGDSLFLELRDRTGVLQTVLPTPLSQTYEALMLRKEAAVCVYGTLKADERANGGVELHADYWRVDVSTDEIDQAINRDSNASQLADLPPLTPSPAPSDKYRLFRKQFHMPSEWAKDPRWIVLQSHSYFKHDHAEAFQLMKRTLSDLGYAGAAIKMKHDYLCFMLADLLRKNGILFLTEEELREKRHENLTKWISGDAKKGLTPDFLIKSATKTPKAHIVDVFAGDSDESESDKIEKYSKDTLSFDVTILNTRSFNTILSLYPFKRFLTDADREYLLDNFRLFEIEYHYWHSSMALERIIFNDRVNVPLQSFTFPEVNNDNKQAWLEKMEAVSKLLLSD